MKNENRSSRRRIDRAGITRSNVIVIIVVLLIGGMIASKSIFRAREAGKRNSCTCRLKQLGLAVHNFHDAKKFLPPGTLAFAGQGDENPAIEDGMTWAALLLPYMEDAELWKQFSENQADQWQGYMPNGNSQQRTVALLPQANKKIFQCPSRRDSLQQCKEGLATEGDSGASSDYAAVAIHATDPNQWFNVGAPLSQAAGVLVGAERFDFDNESSPRLAKWRGRTTLESIADGTTETLLLGEKHITPKGLRTRTEGDGSIYYYHSRNPRPVENGSQQVSAATYAFRGIAWTDADGPSPSIAQNGRTAPNSSQFGSHHNSIVSFVMADGAVKTIRVGIAAKVLARLAHRSDGAKVSVDNANR